MTFYRDRLLTSIPPGAGEGWTTAACDCGRGEPHTNDFLLIGGFICMSANDDDGVIFKWQVVMLEDGAQIARGFGMDMEQCHQQAELTARALVVDHAAWAAKNEDVAPRTH